jgi:hypothetical protein
MIGRLWYPQLDAYDAIRRMASLLAIWSRDNPPSPERLYISDFYLANPPLLHNTNMSREVRERFNGLHISRPEKAFITYPSAPVLFQKMGEVQREAFRTLSGKGLLDLEGLERGIAQPSPLGSNIFSERFLPLLGEDEKPLAAFLTEAFSRDRQDIAALRRNTGLRRTGP